MSREGSGILGGDIAFSLIHRQATTEERAFFTRQGEVSEIANMRAMARASTGAATLVELKAVDASYPLNGRIELDPTCRSRAPCSEVDGRFGAVAEQTLAHSSRVYARRSKSSIGDATSSSSPRRSSTSRTASRPVSASGRG